jgi:two-component system, NtrC family, sensor histidine kinase HydH
VQSFQIQEGLLVGFFFLLIMGVSGLLIGAATNWNKTLKQEVDSKTEALRQSHERLLRSERFAAVGEAAAYVSHEIKNPLMVIGGFARQLIRNADIPDPAQEKLKIISDEVKRLETFLGDLRDFTRPAPPSMKESNVNDIVRDVHHMMEETAGEIGVRLETDLDQDLPLVMLDPNQIKQVLINLVKNSLEAMDGEGKITIVTCIRGGCIALSVTDNGKGIQPEIMREIFNPFFTTKKTGTGLGLAVINKIIEDHHGTITVESTKGHGTTFTVILPTKK